MLHAFLRAWGIAIALVFVAASLALTVRLVGGPGAGLACAVTEIGVLAYSAACWWRPFRDCWCCDGTGKHYKEKDGKRISKTFKPCRWCRGLGRRLRIGRRIYNHFHEASLRAR